MARIHRYAFCLLTVLHGFVGAAGARAQADSVRPNPHAVRLRTFWRMGGDAETTIGTFSGALGDIDNNGHADFSVTREERHGTGYDLASVIFLGASDSSEVRRSQLIPGYLLTTGDFWGAGRQACIFSTWKPFLGVTTQWIRVHRTESDSIVTPAALEFDTVLDSAERHYVMVTSAAAEDLNRDGYDELILAVSYTYRNQAFDNTAEFWIYRGGPDFSIAAPTAVLRDTIEQTSGFETWILTGDVDGDQHPDIVALTEHRDKDVGQYHRVLIWWGGRALEDLSLNPDRAGNLGVTIKMALGDVDGDGRSDILGTRGRIFLSGANKDARSRTFTLEDVDINLAGVYFTQSLGPINDSTGRFDMVGASHYIGPSAGDRMAAFSGSPVGPDLEFDAHWTPALEGAATNLIQSFHPVGDVNGDGWPDALFSSFWWGDYDMGYAAVLLGGSYIPRDFMAAAPSHSDSAGSATFLTVAPNPASGRAIARWQLAATDAPTTLEITDVLGRLMHTATIAASDHSQSIDCSMLAPGLYLIALRDRHGQPLGSTSLFRQ